MKYAFVVALTSLTVLSACSSEKSGALAPVKTTPAALLGSLDGLRGETYVGKDKSSAAADIASVVAALPAGVDITWDTLTFDEAARANVLSNVRITPQDMTEVGLSIATAKLWGFDADFAKARLSGQRLDETARLAERIDLSDVQVFGLETLMSPAMDAYNQALLSTIEGAIDDAEISTQIAAATPSLDNYRLGFSRLIAHDLYLRPWELTPAALPADSDWAEAMPVLQTLAAGYRSVAFDTLALFDMTSALSLVDPNGVIALDMKIDTVASRGSRGLDTDVSLMRGMTFSMSMPIPPPSGALSPDADTPPVLMQMEGALAESQTTGLRLDRAASYLARGQMPPRTETDLLSFGVSEFRDLAFSSDGRRLYGVGSARFDADNFHWLIPAAVQLDVQDYVYDIAGMLHLIEQASAADPAFPETTQDVFGAFARAIPVLEKYNLAAPVSDYALGWNWNPKTGRTSAEYAGSSDDFASMSIRVDGDLPDFDAVSNLIPAEPAAADEQAVQELFTRVSALRSAKAELVDHGGLDKVFALTIDLLNAYRDMLPPEMATFANMTPQSLRQMAVSGMYLFADTAGQEEPLARDMLRPFAGWLDKGGRVEWTLSPASPVTVGVMQAAPANPAAVAERLGLKATHTPPPG